MDSPPQLAANKLALSYIVPLRTSDPVVPLGRYLRDLAAVVDEVIVVDGSEPTDWDEHRMCFPAAVTMLRPAYETRNGKVAGVVTGVHHARNEHVVVADDDIRYRTDQLVHLARLLERAEVVRPQNYFDPRPWHAHFDMARSVLNRCAGGDWPGTLALRRSSFMVIDRYDGDVLFENLELVRTLRANGGREIVALDLLVARCPPTTAHFWSQQVRQAYDEFARPWRLVGALAWLPALSYLALSRRWRSIASSIAIVTLIAELGRRRGRGRTVFPPSSTALAPVWACWRSACSWAALVSWARGGVRYRGQRLRRAANRPAVLRASRRCLRA
jgi:hypothetical protein